MDMVVCRAAEGSLMPSRHPLAGVARWVNERDLYLAVDLVGVRDAEPSGPEWTRLDRLPERVPELIATLMEHSCQGHRISAAAFLAGDVGRQVLAFAASAAYLTGTAPDLSAHLLWVRHGASGRMEGLALRQGTTAVLAEDPAAHRPGAVRVEDEAELDLWLVRRAVDTLAPVIDAVRAHTRFGARPQWSMVADALHAALLAAAEEAGSDQTAAWDRARRMVECINHDRPRVAPRQLPFPLTLAGRPDDRPERVFMVRGGCCFYYRYGPAKCSTCPLSTDTERERVLRDYYEAVPTH